MRSRALLMRGMMLILVLGASRLMAQPADPAAAAGVPQPPADPVLSLRCRTSPTAFGCANAANLATMARPADLLSGAPLAPAPGALEAAAVQRLLTDRVKDLRREGTGAGGTGSGSGSGGGGQ